MKRRLFWPVVLLVLLLSLFLSGCVCSPWCWWGDDAPPRRAVIHVYVSDYYSGAPIRWAVVELAEEDWWDWDYLGAWTVNNAGYVTVYGSLLYYDGRGGPEEKDYQVRVSAGGYYTEYYELELSYYYPAESLYFYMVPAYRDGSPETDPSGTEPLDPLPEGEGPSGRVSVGTQRGQEAQ